MSPDMMIYVAAGLAFVAIAGLGLAFAGGDNTSSKRAKAIGAGDISGGGSRKKADDVGEKRRKQTQQMLTKLREGEKERKKAVNPQNTEARIRQAGLEMSVPAFYIGSVISCAMFIVIAYVSGVGTAGFTMFGFKIPGPGVIAMAGFVGLFGFPRFVLGFITKRRTKKLTGQFADAIDIIVRGVKSGLPLTECLRIIAKESPAPLGTEFQLLTDSVAMGTNIETALQKFYHRVPLPEVNFFVIVLSIQAKAGGNLSEALGNLSAVIRQRKMMREKIKALSSEAKASAWIIGSLPFAVGAMVFVTTPDYIMLLFTTDSGRNIIAIGAVLMLIGLGTMKKMINFDI